MVMMLIMGRRRGRRSWSCYVLRGDAWALAVKKVKIPVDGLMIQPGGGGHDDDVLRVLSQDALE